LHLFLRWVMTFRPEYIAVFPGFFFFFSIPLMGSTASPPTPLLFAVFNGLVLVTLRDLGGPSCLARFFLAAGRSPPQLTEGAFLPRVSFPGRILHPPTATSPSSPLQPPTLDALDPFFSPSFGLPCAFASRLAFFRVQNPTLFFSDFFWPLRIFIMGSRRFIPRQPPLSAI